MSSLSTWEALGIVTQFGVTCALSVGLGFLLGSWIDSRLGTGIIFSLVGAVGGMVSSIISTLRLLKFVAGRAEARKRQAQE